MRTLVPLLAIVLACGPSAAELKTAQTAVYTGDAHRILELAATGAEAEHYKIGGVDEEQLVFETEPRFYSPEGDLQTPGAGNWVQVDNHSVKVSFVVSVSEVDTRRYTITVVPKTWQYVAGSPQMRELTPDDPNLPPFVKGRAEALSVAIYSRTKGYVAPP